MSVAARWMALALAVPLAGAWANEPPAPETTMTHLAANLAESERLLQALDGLREQLATVARRAAENADLATAYDERRRHEELGRAAQARLAELDAARDELIQAIETLRRQISVHR